MSKHLSSADLLALNKYIAAERVHKLNAYIEAQKLDERLEIEAAEQLALEERHWLESYGEYMFSEYKNEEWGSRWRFWRGAWWRV